ncbi:MAG: hypothetical protein HQK75_12405 [Candidatus Magnetomorum sp.]|nr:hypothetical protein [Candidatus Magnetomorum sp.]
MLILSQAVYAQSLDIHGYISQGFLYSNKYNYLADTDGGTFQFNEMGINFVKRASDSAFIGLQISARDLGDIGNDKPYIDWALADYRIADILGLRFGKLKVPIGFYNETRDIDMLRTSVLLPSGVYIELLRDAWNGLKGFELYGDISHPLAGSFDYQCAIGSMEILDDSNAAKMYNSVFKNPITNIRSFQVDKTIVWGIQWHLPFSQIKLGNTFFFTEWNNIADFNLILPAIDPIPVLAPGEHPAFPDGHPGFSGCDPIQIDQEISIQVKHVMSYTLSASVQLYNLLLSAEYFHLKLDNIVDAPMFNYANDTATALSDHGGTVISKTKIAGYYLSATHRVTDTFELGAYYSWITNDVDDKDGKQAEKQPGNHDYSQWLRDYCLSALLEISEQWSFKLEGHLMDGHAYVYLVDNPPLEHISIPDGVNPEDFSPYEASFPDRYWFMLAAKVTFSF